MPTYEFKCSECENRCEITESVKLIDYHQVVCDKCGTLMKRVFTAPAAIFKGDGFYSSARKRALKKELDRRTEEKQK